MSDMVKPLAVKDVYGENTEHAYRTKEHFTLLKATVLYTKYILSSFQQTITWILKCKKKKPKIPHL